LTHNSVCAYNLPQVKMTVTVKKFTKGGDKTTAGVNCCNGLLTF
jgi:hypothetical protein